MSGISATMSNLIGAETVFHRIAEARSAVLDRIEEVFSRTSEGEASALGYDLHMLIALLHIAEREIGEQKRTGT